MQRIIGKLGGSGRTFQMRANILVSGIMKVAGLAISLLMVPITLDYVSKAEFGIWMTISTILYWFAFLDVGLGNGMRNYMAVSVSEGDMPKAGRYFTTTMLLLTLIFGAAYLVAVMLLPFVDLTRLFNTYILSDSYLKKVMLVALTFTLLTFVLKNIGYVYAALQRYAVVEVLGLLGHLLGFIAIIILTHTNESSLFYLVAALTAAPVIVYALCALPTFHFYPDMRPSRSKVDLSLRNQVIGKGLGFFGIQITSCLVIFGSSNVFISHYCGPESVTVYNLSFKLFNLLIVGYTIFISPLWNGYTDASVKGDWPWIERTFFRSLKVWGLFVVAGLVMLACSDLFFQLWLHDRVQIPLSVSVCTLLYVVLFNLNNCATYLINGLNVIRVQIISSIVTTILYVAVVFVFGYRFTLEGMILCLAGSYALMSAVHLYQCYLIIRRRATGIWNK